MGGPNRDGKTPWRSLAALLWSLLLLAGLLVAPPAASAALQPPTLELSPRQGCYAAGEFAQLLVDPDGTLTIEQAAAEATAGRFRDLGTKHVSLGFGNSVIWLRLRLAEREPFASQDRGRWWVLSLGPRPFHSVRLYLPANSLDPTAPPGAWQVEELGDHLRFVSAGAGPDQVLRLPPLSPKPVEVYLRVEATVRPLTFPLEVMTASGYLQDLRLRMVLQGCYLGIILVMALYNLFLFFSLEDRSYLWYVLYVTCLLAYFSGSAGLISQLAPSLDRILVVRFSLASLTLVFILAAQFARSFLMTRQHTPRGDKALRIFMAFAGLLGLASPWLDLAILNRAFSAIGTGASLLSVCIGFLCLRAGFQPARFYLLAWVVFSLGAITYGLTYRGIVPYSFIGMHSLQITSAMEATLLSLALADRIRLLRQRERRYQHQAITDELTGLYNVRHFWRTLAADLDRIVGPDRVLSLLILDLDNFKYYNDSFGHVEGDRVLARLGEVLRRTLREGDLAFRYGGEEFAVIFPGLSAEMAHEVAERLRQAMYREIFIPVSGREARLTVSLGLAQAADGEGPGSLVKRADAAMYRAKQAGGNQVRTSAPA